MNKALLFTVLLLLTLNEPALSEEQHINPVLLDEIEKNTLRPFFNALKNGDVEQIKHFFSGEIYSEYRLLLEENKGYPDLLREYYKDAVFSIERGVTADNMVTIDFSIEFPGKGKQVSQYILQKQSIENIGRSQADERRWSIVDQRHLPAR